jgi:hypothetical protein
MFNPTKKRETSAGHYAGFSFLINGGDDSPDNYNGINHQKFILFTDVSQKFGNFLA